MTPKHSRRRFLESIAAIAAVSCGVPTERLLRADGDGFASSWMPHSAIPDLYQRLIEFEVAHDGSGGERIEMLGSPWTFTGLRFWLNRFDEEEVASSRELFVTSDGRQDIGLLDVFFHPLIHEVSWESSFPGIVQEGDLWVAGCGISGDQIAGVVFGRKGFTEL